MLIRTCVVCDTVWPSDKPDYHACLECGGQMGCLDKTKLAYEIVQYEIERKVQRIRYQTQMEYVDHFNALNNAAWRAIETVPWDANDKEWRPRWVTVMDERQWEDGTRYRK